MRRLFATLLLSLSTGLVACAQLFYTPGYLVTSSGDTLRGEIRGKDNTTVLFRAAGNSPERQYSPETVLAYGSEEMISRSVRFAENGVTRLVFMHEVVDGPVGLFELVKPEERLSHALRLTDQTYIPLRGNLALLLLTKHLSDCSNPLLRQLLTTTSFYNSRAYFERVVHTYNQCRTPNETPVKPKKAFHYEAGLLAGGALNSWYYGANEVRLSPYWNPNGNFNSMYTGVFGAFFTIAPRKRLSINLEALYSSYKGSRLVKVNNPLNATDPAARQYAFREQYLSFPIVGRYALGTRPMRWYVKAGISVNHALVLTGSYSSTAEDVVIPFRRGLSVGYLAGLGAEIPLGHKRHLLIEIRTVPHYVLDGVTRIANSRSFQLTAAVPLVTR